MAYLPGSHQIGLRKFVNIFEGDPEDILADPQVSAIEPVLVEVPKGSVAFHHGLTVHLAEANPLDRPRAVHTIIYFPDGSTRGYPNVHFAVDRRDPDQVTRNPSPSFFDRERLLGNHRRSKNARPPAAPGRGGARRSLRITMCGRSSRTATSRT